MDSTIVFDIPRVALAEFVKARYEADINRLARVGLESVASEVIEKMLDAVVDIKYNDDVKAVYHRYAYEISEFIRAAGK